MVMEYPRSEAEEHERLGQQTEAQHRLFRMAIDHAPAGIIILDGKELRAKWVNPAYRQFLEEPCRNKDITGMALQDFLPGAEESGLADMFRRVAATGQPYVNPEYEYVGFSRGTTYWRGSVLPLFPEGGGTPDLMVLIIEVTEQVLARKEVKDYAGELQKANEELQSQAGELLAQKEELAEADRRKDEFLAMLSHELRNPLGAIGNVAEVLRLRGASDPTCEEIHAVLQRQVQHMTRLLDDLLDVARIAHGKIELRKKPVDLATAVTQAVETARPLIEARSHELRISLPARPVWLEADPTRLEQILTNLLNNAAKYTKPGGRIGLTAEREGKQAPGSGPEPAPGSIQGRAVLRVWDTGVGIAPELLPRIFNPFMQGDGSPGRSLGGLGVGLTLVRRLVEMHGGSVEAYSAGPGRGSKFVVCLPISDCGLPAAEPPHLPSEVADPPTKRVLVVDDNVDTARMLALALRMWGHQVKVVHDGPAAIEAAIGYRPEVVLIDIGMPGMDGYEVARRLRQQAGLSGAMLVALTGYGHEEAQRRSRESGFDQHLVKPVGAARLQELLEVAPKGSQRNGKGVQQEDVTVV